MITNATVDFNAVSFISAVVTFALVLPLLVLMRHRQVSVTPLLPFLVLMLALAGVLGAAGRMFDADETVDRLVRIGLVTLRMAVIGALAHDLWYLWRARPAGHRGARIEAEPPNEQEDI